MLSIENAIGWTGRFIIDRPYNVSTSTSAFNVVNHQRYDHANILEIWFRDARSVIHNVMLVPHGRIIGPHPFYRMPSFGAGHQLGDRSVTWYSENTATPRSSRIMRVPRERPIATEMKEVVDVSVTWDNLAETDVVRHVGIGRVLTISGSETIGSQTGNQCCEFRLYRYI
jgi:uncharacterized protein with WD repeat